MNTNSVGDYECNFCDRKQRRTISEKLATQCGWEKQSDDTWLCPFCSDNEDKLKAVFMAETKQ